MAVQAQEAATRENPKAPGGLGWHVPYWGKKSASAIINKHERRGKGEEFSVEKWSVRISWVVFSLCPRW